jgi:CubicO group peptidase (beta-lactamase class C family)
MSHDLKRLLLSHSVAVLLATVIFAPACWAAAAPATQRDAAERIAEILEAQRSEQHIPGFAFALVRKDRLELVIVRGVLDELKRETEALAGQAPR